MCPAMVMAEGQEPGDLRHTPHIIDFRSLLRPFHVLVLAPGNMLLVETCAGPAVVSRSGDGGRSSLVFRGTLLEGLQGKSLDKRLEQDTSFCDVDYILACLQQVMANITCSLFSMFSIVEKCKCWLVPLWYTCVIIVLFFVLCVSCRC